LDQLTFEQLNEWEAYDKIDPIGTWREDFRMASLASLIENIVQHLYAKKGTKPKAVTPLDHMPNWGDDSRMQKETVKMSVEDMKKVFLSIASTQNKKVKNDKRIDAPPKKLRK
jgi:hypothetical protein